MTGSRAAEEGIVMFAAFELFKKNPAFA